MSNKILIDANYNNEIRAVLIDKTNLIQELEYEITHKSLIKGNIYLAKVVKVEPSLQAAFIDYGVEKNGFLPFSEIHPNYYHVPISDRDSKELFDFKPINSPQITEEDLKKDSTQKNNFQNDNLDTLEINLDISNDSIHEIAEETNPDTSNFQINEKNNMYSLYHQYRIQEVIRKNQILLVQAQKDERGNKGAFFTTYLSLAGKYCILMPNKAYQNGISRRITDIEERKRFKKIINQLVSPQDLSQSSIIIRTAAQECDTYEIKRDYDYLAKLWNQIREITLNSIAPTFIHMEEGVIQKAIRNMFDRHVDEVLVQGYDAYMQAVKFAKQIIPTKVNKIKEYKFQTSIFTQFNVEKQIMKLYQPVVSLPSGGYIVINPTEALTSIDINSGRAIMQRNVEETAIKINLEAAQEIARQIRLRDISGLIVIDFIDMKDINNRYLVEKTLIQFCNIDRARMQIGHISHFGLLEMSRQRLKSSFLENHTAICTYCSGKGLVRLEQANSMITSAISGYFLRQ